MDNKTIKLEPEEFDKEIERIDIEPTRKIDINELQDEELKNLSVEELKAKLKSKGTSKQEAKIIKNLLKSKK
ncbi:MAG: hypothetical protein LBC44_04705 [Mycoplasmataceae bacterium]|jgi:hypothetical protein|nr:hypothetical protein [Mycoplasmataceae bacterium]